MSNRRIALLLLLPAVALAATSHRRRHMWMQASADEGDPGFTAHETHGGRGPWRGHGRRAGHVPPMWSSGGIPPKLQLKLDQWHTAAHGGTVDGADTTA